LFCYLSGVSTSSYRHLRGLAEYLGSLMDRHLNTINCLFCSGYVKAMNLDNLSRRNAANTIAPMFTVEFD